MADQIQVATLGGAPAKPGRLAYIDWLRGLACLGMFQAHCYNSWLNADARQTEFYRWSQAVATLPAPLFIFLAGLSSAMITQRLREKGAARNAIARTTILRGAEIFGLGLLFRGQEYLLGLPKSPWIDLLRVDVLNILGLSIMLVGVLCWLTAAATPDISGKKGIGWGLFAAAVIAIATPWLWTTHQPSWLPWPLESYINGVHTFSQPQPWLFPIFPWVAFAVAGLTAACFLKTEYAETHLNLVFPVLAAVGLGLLGVSLFFDALPIHLYSVYDFWHTSPDFFLARLGILLIILAACRM